MIALQTKACVQPINGKTIYDYSNNLDYSLKKADERVKYLNDRLYNEDGNLVDYLRELFETRMDKLPSGEPVDGSYFKVCLTKNDCLCSDTDVSKALEKMADYILRADEISKMDNCTQSSSNLQRNYNEHNASYEALLESNYSSITEELAIKAKRRNYKLDKMQKITSADLTDTDFNSNVVSFKTDEKGEIEEKSVSTVNLLSEYSKLANAVGNKSGRSRRMVAKIRQDQVILKDMVKRRVDFKHVGKDTCRPDYHLANYGDENILRAALQVTGGMSSELGVIKADMDNLVERTTLSLIETEMLQDHRRDSFDYSAWTKRLGVSRSNVFRRLKRIIHKIALTYESSYEDWMYTNYLRGSYKKCSGCGEVKLVTRFHKDCCSKDGLYALCKDCKNAPR